MDYDYVEDQVYRSASNQPLLDEIENLENKIKKLKNKNENLVFWNSESGQALAGGIFAITASIILAVIITVFGLKCNAAWHNSQIACMSNKDNPGWVEKVITKGNSTYQYRVWDKKVICTDGKKRWVVER